MICQTGVVFWVTRYVTEWALSASTEVMAKTNDAVDSFVDFPDDNVPVQFLTPLL